MEETPVARGLRPKRYDPTQSDMPTTQRVGIHNALSTQAEAIGELHSAVNVLFERLATVLSQVPSKEEIKNDIVEPYSVLDKIGANTGSVRSAFRRLNDILERLEV